MIFVDLDFALFVPLVFSVFVPPLIDFLYHQLFPSV